MSAGADDLRFYYGQAIGPAVVLTLVGTTPVYLTDALSPGKYRVRAMDVAGGAKKLWMAQGAQAGNAAGNPPTTAVAVTGAAPSHPIDVSAAPIEVVETMVTNALDNGLGFRTDAGTVTVVVAKVSR